MYDFIGFYNGKQVQVSAPTSYDAQKEVAKLLKVRKNQHHMITVMRSDISHSTQL